jgi:hypothetical protein
MGEWLERGCSATKRWGEVMISSPLGTLTATQRQIVFCKAQYCRGSAKDDPY